MRLLMISLVLALAIGVCDWGWRSVQKPPRAQQGAMNIRAQPLVLDASMPERTTLGRLHFLGAWHLTGGSRSFGGLSSMQILPDGRIRALNDGATLFTFPKPGEQGRAEVQWLPLADPKAPIRQRPMDSESMAFDADSGRSWVGFESVQRICRYAPGFTHVERCRDWPEMQHWSPNAGIESLARLPDGRFVAIAEGAVGDRRGRDMLIFAGDPVAADTPSPVRMRYIPPVGYDPTDAVATGNGRLLVLNRRATIYDGFTARLTAVELKDMKADAIVIGQEVARFAPPVLVDNYEGLAIEQGRDGQRIMWLVSDDNFLFFERTLLLKFALPEDL